MLDELYTPNLHKPVLKHYEYGDVQVRVLHANYTPCKNTTDMRAMSRIPPFRRRFISR